MKNYSQVEIKSMLEPQRMDAESKSIHSPFSKEGADCNSTHSPTWSGASATIDTYIRFAE